MEQTLVLIKPDGVKKSLIGKVIATFEGAGFKIAGIKMLNLTKEDAKRFYEVHKDKHFYESVTNFISSGPIVAMVLEGKEAILKVREIMGPTDSKKAPKGTIRGDFGYDVEKNIVHGSDSKESAEREIPFFFTRNELL